MHCAHPEHHHSADDLLANLRAACAQRGLRLTELRETVYALIARSAKPVKAYDLLDQLKAVRPGLAAPPTVYRALDFLLGNGFVHKLETLNAFIACPHPVEGQHATQFLICEHCLETVELEDSGISRQVARQAEVQGFVPKRHTIEVYGLCSHCAQHA